MDAGLVGAIVTVVVVAIALFLLKPKKTAPLSEMLEHLDRINADGETTSVQKRSLSEAVYNTYRKRTVSVVGRVSEVFTNGSAIIETPMKQAPFLGFDFEKIKDAQLHAFTKGRSMTLRASLDTWEKYRAATSVSEVLNKSRVFCDKRWYAVKNLYLAGSHGMDKGFTKREAT